MASRGFASDNQSGAHPEVLAAIAAANAGHVPAYGDDAHTARAGEVLRSHLGAEAEVFFVFNGTGANVDGSRAGPHARGRRSSAPPPRTSRPTSAERPERFTGSKLLARPHTRRQADTRARAARISPASASSTTSSPR